MQHGTHHYRGSRLTITGLSRERWIISGHVGGATITTEPLPTDAAMATVRRLCPPELAAMIIGPAVERRDIVCQGAPGAWLIKSADGRRCSEPLDDRTAARFCRRLGIRYPGGQR